MPTPFSVLIASASAGTGHVRAAEALRDAFALREPAARIEHVDVLNLAPRWLRTGYGAGYETLAARAPTLWRELYTWADGPGADAPRWAALARKTLFNEFTRLLDRGWDLVLCTHFLPCQLAAGRAGTPPLALVITDFGIHRYWAQPHVRLFFVASRALGAEVRRRVRGARVIETGIPVSPAFLDAPPRREARALLGLDPSRPVVLVMGGGLGLGVQHAVRGVLAADVPGLQVVALTGRNEAAAGALRALRVPPNRLRVLGFVEDVPRWMAAADLVVTKPGGLTCSEALALARPLLLTRAIPGHEERNARALIAAGVAVYASTGDAISAHVHRTLAEPSLLARMAEQARRQGRPHAAHVIAGTVVRDLVLRDVA